MSIDFGNYGIGVNTHSPDNKPNVLNLRKGDVLNLTKNGISLKKCTVGCGWDPKLDELTGRKSSKDKYDLDVSAFLLHEDGKVHDPSKEVVFFNAPRQRGIYSTGDNRDGEGDGDDEQIKVRLEELDPAIHSIVFVVNIFEADKKNQTFGQLTNVFIRMFDEEQNNNELLRYNLEDEYSTETGLIFAKIFKHNNYWLFEAIGEGIYGDLNSILTKFL